MSKSLRWKVAQTAELKWWRNYMRNKDKAEYLTWKKGYWNSLLEKIATDLKLQPKQTLLDAGCGPAGIFIVLNDNPVTAVDPLLDQYETNLSQFNKSDYPNVTFHNSPLEDYKDDKQYDVVFCMNAINHVSDLGRSFDLLVQLTKPGGKLVVTIDAHNHAFFKHLFRLIPGDILHPHQFDLQEYEAMLTDRGCVMMNRVNLKHEFFFDHHMVVVKRVV